MAISNEQLMAGIKKNPIVVGSLVVALLIGVGMYLRGGLEGEIGADLEQKSKKGQRMANNLKFAVGLDEQLAEMTEDREKMEARLVDEGQLAVNLQYFYSLESATGTELTDLRQIASNPAAAAKKKKTKGTYQPIAYAVSLTGNYEQVMSFLQKLEAGKHFCRITMASLTPSGEAKHGGRPDVLTLTLSLELLGQP